MPPPDISPFANQPVGWTDILGKATALMVGTVVCIAASIAGDTSQDLKTGFLLGATAAIEGLAPGPAQENCDSQLNDQQVATAIRLANTYSNVVTVSVGNETSFFSAFMPLNCLEGYIRETRNNVTQPVTADDDYTFYANFFGRSPDGVIREIDFVAIHMYPITNYRFWDWQQLGVPPGPQRAEAMMNESLAVAQRNYQAVYDYRYRDATGKTVTIGETRLMSYWSMIGKP